MVRNADADVLVGDYLAEVTMRILSKLRDRDPEAGYAASFLPQLRPVLGLLATNDTRIVVNAGGLNPEGLAVAVRALCTEADVHLPVATVLGDDVIDRADHAGVDDQNFIPRTANAYLGGWGIAEALSRGARIVITGRVADASLIVGPAAWWHGWKRDDWDALAGALIAGHVIECGTQATGGNFSGFTSLSLDKMVFPIAAVARDGSSVISKPEPSGGAVSVATVTAQLLYEIQGRRYANSDVVADLTTVQLAQSGDQEVTISGTKGSPPPPTTKVALTGDGLWVNEVLLGVTGTHFEQKREVISAALHSKFQGNDAITDLRVELLGSETSDANTQNASTGFIRAVVQGTDDKVTGRVFANALVELGLASYPGLFGISPPGKATRAGEYRVGTISQVTLEHRVIDQDGAVVPILPTEETAPFDPGFDQHAEGEEAALSTETRPVVLGEIAHARSGDKGGDANLGLWVESDTHWEWLHAWLTPERLVQEVLPEARGLQVQRLTLPHLRAVNFVITNLLEGGAASSLRLDSQAKGLAEFVRSRIVPVPSYLLDHQE